MNEQDILDMFFNDVLPSIAKGELKTEDAVFNIRFNTAIYHGGSVKYIANIHNPNLPTMLIKKMDMFSHLLFTFINKVMNSNMKWCTPYIAASSEVSKIKYYLSVLWSNMTANDFIDPEYYIARYISFLEDKTFNNLNLSYGPLNKLNDCYLEVTNVEELACYETPYAFRMVIKSDDGKSQYVLPDVKYAIENYNGENRAYIYAVQYDYIMQKVNDSDKKFSSKINRALYKVNQDVPKEELDKKMQTQTTGFTVENIVDVTPSALVSLTVALSLFNKEGIEKIYVPGYLPLMWDAKKITYDRKLAFYKSIGCSQDKIDAKEKEYLEEQFRIQRNITDKMLRNFVRLEYHFDGVDVIAYPLDVDDFLHVSLASDFKAYNSNHLLGEVASKINCEQNLIKK